MTEERQRNSTGNKDNSIIDLQIRYNQQERQRLALPETFHVKIPGIRSTSRVPIGDTQNNNNNNNNNITNNNNNNSIIRPSWTISGISNPQMCGVCRHTSSRYTCPRCHLPYCGVECFAKHGKGCSESFFRSQVEEGLKLSEITSEAKSRMVTILKREQAQSTDQLTTEQGVATSQGIITELISDISQNSTNKEVVGEGDDVCDTNNINDEIVNHEQLLSEGQKCYQYSGSGWDGGCDDDEEDEDEDEKKGEDEDEDQQKYDMSLDEEPGRESRLTTRVKERKCDQELRSLQDNSLSEADEEQCSDTDIPQETLQKLHLLLQGTLDFLFHQTAPNNDAISHSLCTGSYDVMDWLMLLECIDNASIHLEDLPSELRTKFLAQHPEAEEAISIKDESQIPRNKAWWDPPTELLQLFPIPLPTSLTHAGISSVDSSIEHNDPSMLTIWPSECKGWPWTIESPHLEPSDSYHMHNILSIPYLPQPSELSSLKSLRIRNQQPDKRLSPLVLMQLLDIYLAYITTYSFFLCQPSSTTLQQSDDTTEAKHFFEIVVEYSLAFQEALNIQANRRRINTTINTGSNSTLVKQSAFSEVTPVPNFISTWLSRIASKQPSQSSQITKEILLQSVRNASLFLLQPSLGLRVLTHLLLLANELLNHRDSGKNTSQPLMLICHKLKFLRSLLRDSVLSTPPTTLFDAEFLKESLPLISNQDQESTTVTIELNTSTHRSLSLIGLLRRATQLQRADYQLGLLVFNDWKMRTTEVNTNNK